MQGGTSAIEAAKARLVGQAATLAEAALGATDPARARRYIAEFYEHVPPADVAGRDPVDLCGAATALWHLAARRQPGTALVRVYNPRPATDGWTSPRTIVAIVNDDMPFLVDSVTMEVNRCGLTLHSAIHPVYRVWRDAQGAIARIEPGGAVSADEASIHGSHLESFIHFETTFCHVWFA